MADVFEILGDDTRRRLVEALRAGERSVGELVQVVDIGQPGVSRQLQILEEARFVRMRPDGRRRLYALRPERFKELDEWASRYRDLWEARLDRFGAELERRKKARANDKQFKQDRKMTCDGTPSAQAQAGAQIRSSRRSRWR